MNRFIYHEKNIYLHYTYCMYTLHNSDFFVLHVLCHSDEPILLWYNIKYFRLLWVIHKIRIRLTGILP